MAKKITPIYLPKETVNDLSYLLVEVSLNSGDKIRANQVFASFETSKALIEITSPVSGFVHHRLKVGARLFIGDLVGLVTNDVQFPTKQFEALCKPEINAERKEKQESDLSLPTTRFSKAAAELLRDRQLDPKIFSHLNLVKRSDVEKYLSSIGSRDRELEGKQVLTQSDYFGEISGNEMLICGGGGHAKICIDIIRQTGDYRIVGIVDNNIPAGTNVFGIPVIGNDRDLARLRKKGIQFAVNAVGAVTQHRRRSEIFNTLVANGYFLPNLIHPSAVIEPSAKLGNGNHIMANSTIGSAVTIGNNCIINSAAVISHDSVIEDNVHLAPGAILGGSVHIGPDSLIGMGATVYLGLTIGAGTVINNGVNLTRDVSENSVIKR